MENIQQPENKAKEYRNARGGFLNVLLITLIIFTALYGGYLQFKKIELKKNITSTQEIIDAQLSNTLPEDQQEVSLQSMKLFLEDKKTEQLFWTNVFIKFEETLPDATKIETNNFTGNSDGNISFAAKTTRSSVDPYLDTATMIAKFKDKPFFTDMYIPSISSTVNEQGEEFLSYTVRVNYLKDATDNEIIDINSKPSNNSETTATNPETVQNLLDIVRSRTQPSNPLENE